MRVYFYTLSRESIQVQMGLYRFCSKYIQPFCPELNFSGTPHENRNICISHPNILGKKLSRNLYFYLIA